MAYSHILLLPTKQELVEAAYEKASGIWDKNWP